MNYPGLFSDEFTKEYYDFLYGGIHANHDYVTEQANVITHLYGTDIKILDVGCSCGILVEELRNRGCDAWGIDVSDYALSQSHVPGFTKIGSQDDIPFPDKYFDVVFSRVAIGYCDSLEDVIKELRRVGHKQFHTIDTSCIPPAYGYKLIKPLEWWKLNFPENEG